MADAVAGTSSSRVLYYSRNKPRSGKVRSVGVNICDGQNGNIRVEVIADFGEEDVIREAARLMESIFPSSELAGSQRIEEGHRVFTLLVPRIDPDEPASAESLKRASNEIFGCAKGVLESICCHVCADSADSEETP